MQYGFDMKTVCVLFLVALGVAGSVPSFASKCWPLFTVFLFGVFAAVFGLARRLKMSNGSAYVIATLFVWLAFAYGFTVVFRIANLKPTPSAPVQTGEPTYRRLLTAELNDP